MIVILDANPAFFYKFAGLTFIMTSMKKTALMILMVVMSLTTLDAQSALKKIYDESIDPVEQIDKALKQAGEEGKFVISQVGGNWCRWCLMFADFIRKDAELTEFINDNFVYIHSNYNPRERAGEKTLEMLRRLGNPARFGFPVFVVMDADGKVLHIQDSSLLEEGNGYNREKVSRFLQNWTPSAVGQ